MREKWGLTILSQGVRILRANIPRLVAGGQNGLSPFFAPPSNLRRWRRIACLLALTTVFICAQSFEVASVKLNTVAMANTLTRLPGGERFRATNFPLLWLIGEAYHVPNRQITGLPEAMGRECYDIEAKADHPVNREQMMAMLRTLLEDRFKLVVRREMKEIKAYALTVAKGGPKMEENRDGAELYMDRIGRSKWGFHNMPMTLLANVLSSWAGDTVVDQTGLTGNYDFTLEVQMESNGPGVREGREPAPDPAAPSVFTAVQEQIGLRLESRKGPVEMLVIDHIQRLSGN
ncbi:MAG TPA: TIGR03435 family protein [Bryobacteraceae bacterium]|jgi:uncharacterized protein (TIGR03435 family)|nr:TIGR03435 family protein [Bryobacteraceae bacterium]